MSKAQHGFQHADQRPPRAALLGVVTGLDLDLGDFQIPVAELVPDKFVDRLGEQVEAVVGEMLLDFGLDALQLADDPAVGETELEPGFTFGHDTDAAGLLLVVEREVVARDVHQHEAGRVPQLVAEIAVAVAAVEVELDVAAGRGEARRK